MKMFLTALGFLTLIPYHRGLKTDRASLGRSMAAFPIVGLLLGGALVVSNAFLSQHMSERLVNIVMITSLFVITGGLHIDGFMDTVDGLAGGRTKEDVLRIMRDSHVGALGVVGVCLLVLVKWEALNSMESGSKNAALFIMPVVGRWGMTLLAYTSTYARDEGLGRPFVEGLTRNGLLFAFATALAVSVLLGGVGGVIVLAAASIMCLLWSKWFERKIGGVTGDVIGALNEALELLVALFFAVLI